MKRSARVPLPYAISAALIMALLAAATSAANQLVFSYNGRTSIVETTGGEKLLPLAPIMQLVGASMYHSRSAGTWIVTWKDRTVQIAPNSSYVLWGEKLVQVSEGAKELPSGVLASSLGFLKEGVLRGLGLTIRRSNEGIFLIEEGGRLPGVVPVKVVAVDFGSRATVVVTMGSEAEAEVMENNHSVIIKFHDRVPRIDSVSLTRTALIKDVRIDDGNLRLDLDPSVSLRNWHLLTNPPRVTLDVGPSANKVSQEGPQAGGQSELSAKRGPGPVVIDPGHGGDDTGAVSESGVTEKDVVLAIAKRVAARLSRLGIPVLLTRSGDQYRSLADRTALANRVNARAFISLHANSYPLASARGAETFYVSLDRTSTDERAAQTAETENAAGRGNNLGPHQSPNNHTVQLILWDMAQAEVINESAELALDVQKQLNIVLGLPDRGVKQAPFAVLKGATMPAILVEVGFLSNPEEAARLADPKYQDRVASAIAAGIATFLQGAR